MHILCVFFFWLLFFINFVRDLLLLKIFSKNDYLCFSTFYRMLFFVSFLPFVLHCLCFSKFLSNRGCLMTSLSFSPREGP
jgi:hypothetical protein